MYAHHRWSISLQFAYKCKWKDMLMEYCLQKSIIKHNVQPYCTKIRKTGQGRLVISIFFRNDGGPREKNPKIHWFYYFKKGWQSVPPPLSYFFLLFWENFWHYVCCYCVLFELYIVLFSINKHLILSLSQWAKDWKIVH